MPALDASAGGNGAASTPDLAKDPAAASVEKIYNSYPSGTDTTIFVGLNAADAAAAKLRADFLNSIQNPQKDNTNRTAFDRELDQLGRDALHGDGTLEAAALDWGIHNLGTSGATTQQQLEDAATPAPGGNQSGDAQYDQFMAGYLAGHFTSFDHMGHPQELPSQGIGVDYLTLSDLNAALGADEGIRTYIPTPLKKGGLATLKDWL